MGKGDKKMFRHMLVTSIKLESTGLTLSNGEDEIRLHWRKYNEPTIEGNIAGLLHTHVDKPRVQCDEHTIRVALSSSVHLVWAATAAKSVTICWAESETF